MMMPQVICQKTNNQLLNIRNSMSNTPLTIRSQEKYAPEQANFSFSGMIFH
jgi:hypothetical protein